MRGKRLPRHRRRQGRLQIRLRAVQKAYGVRNNDEGRRSGNEYLKSKAEEEQKLFFFCFFINILCSLLKKQDVRGMIYPKS